MNLSAALIESYKCTFAQKHTAEIFNQIAMGIEFPKVIDTEIGNLVVEAYATVHRGYLIHGGDKNEWGDNHFIFPAPQHFNNYEGTIIEQELYQYIVHSSFIDNKLGEVPPIPADVTLNFDMDDVGNTILLVMSLCPGEVPAYVKRLKKALTENIIAYAEHIGESKEIDIFKKVAMVRNLETKYAKLFEEDKE